VKRLNENMNNSQNHQTNVSPSIVYSAGSQLLPFKSFLKTAKKDVIQGLPFTKRLFIQNIVKRYRYSSLGLFWAFIPSALIAILLTLGQRAGISALTSQNVPPQVYGIFGIVMMQIFLESFNSQRMFLTYHIHFFIRQKIPLEAFILAGLGENMFNLVMRLPVLIAVLIFFDITPKLTIILLPFGFLLLIILGSSIGLFLAPWNALSNDLDSIMQVLPWFLFGITPVFVLPSDGTLLHRIFLFNPLTHIFETIRWLTYGGEINHPFIFGLITFMTIFLFVLGWLYCKLCLPYVVERTLN
jgi:lipopolysaccharide transport system permease protein